METRIAEIADGIYRLSTFVPDIAPPSGFTFNQFLVLGDEPLLFHTGLRRMFPLHREALSRVVAPERLRWVAFGHYEADECGAMNEWLAVAPNAQVAHGRTGCMVSLSDMADRAPRVLADGEAIDLGSKRLRYIDTPHTPHGWDAGVMFEDTTGTLLCGDLFTQLGDGPALTESDVVGPAIEAEDLFRFSSLNPHMGATIRELAKFSPRRLALMHGPSFAGDGVAALHALADDYDRRVRALWPNARTMHFDARHQSARRMEFAMTDTTIYFSSLSCEPPRFVALLGRSLRQAIMVHSIRRTLNSLPDVVLRDIGLTRGEIPSFAKQLAMAGEAVSNGLSTRS